MLSRILLLTALLFVNTSNADALAKEQFAKGFTLYNQHDWINSQEPLITAAKAGSNEAQYYLAEALRLSNRYMTEESQRWYEAAAEQNDLFAMIRLSDSNDLCGTLQESCKKTVTIGRARPKK
jgi:uncharacterized protein